MTHNPAWLVWGGVECLPLWCVCSSFICKWDAATHTVTLQIRVQNVENTGKRESDTAYYKKLTRKQSGSWSEEHQLWTTACFERGGEFLLSGLLQLYSFLYNRSLPHWRITEISWNKWLPIQPAVYGRKIQVTSVSWPRVVLPNQFKNCQPLAPTIQN